MRGRRRPGCRQADAPCLGGQDESGSTGASHWINNTFGGLFANSSTFGTGGTFSVQIFVKATLDDGHVCGEDVTCAVVTRADHFDTNDRKYDVHVPRACRADPAGDAG